MIKKFLIGETDHPFIQLVRYGLVVCVAFPIDFGLLFVFTSKLGINYVLSAIMSFTISMVVNFALSVLWVFKTREKRALWHEATVFGIIGFVGLGLTAVLIWLFTSVLGLHYLQSKLVVVTIVFFWSFGARRYFFQKKIPATSVDKQ